MTTRTTTTGGAALTTVLALSGLTVLGSSLLLRDELPARLATHWDLTGTQDGDLGLAAATAVPLVITVLAGIAVVAVRTRAAGRDATRWLTATALGLAVGVAVLHLAVLLANRGAASPAAVDLPSSGLLAAGAALLAAGTIGWAVDPGEDTAPAPLATTAVAVAPGEAVVWHGSARPHVTLVLLPATLVLGAALLAATTGDAVPAGILVAAAVLVATMLRLRLTVGPAGVTVRLGPFRQRVPLDDVEDVRAEVVDPMAAGGWGYRVLPGQRAFVVRGGPGIRVVRADGPDLVVTVDDAGTAAGVLTAHVQARDARAG